jgi:Protein of unknown function (DUF3551)
MRKIVVGIVTGIALAAATGGTAHADPYRWCAVHNYGDLSESCYFRTFQQCRASLTGGDEFCRRNGYYAGDARMRSPRTTGMAADWR